MTGFIVIVNQEPRSRKAQQHVEARVKANQCVMCDEHRTDKEGKPVPIGTLGPNGHCDHCRYLVRSRCEKLTDVEAAELKASFIRDGLMLGKHEIIQLKRQHVVDQRFAELKNKSKR